MTTAKLSDFAKLSDNRLFIIDKAWGRSSAKVQALLLEHCQ